MATVDTGSNVCRRCKENESTHTIRSEPTCGSVKPPLSPKSIVGVTFTNTLTAPATADMCR